MGRILARRGVVIAAEQTDGPATLTVDDDYGRVINISCPFNDGVYFFWPLSLSLGPERIRGGRCALSRDNAHRINASTREAIHFPPRVFFFFFFFYTVRGYR